MDCIALALYIFIRPAYIYTLQHCVVGFSCLLPASLGRRAMSGKRSIRQNDKKGGGMGYVP